jgi:hypothetical protein
MSNEFKVPNYGVVDRFLCQRQIKNCVPGIVDYVDILDLEKDKKDLILLVIEKYKSCKIKKLQNCYELILDAYTILTQNRLHIDEIYEENGAQEGMIQRVHRDIYFARHMYARYCQETKIHPQQNEIEPMLQLVYAL